MFMSSGTTSEVSATRIASNPTVIQWRGNESGSMVNESGSTITDSTNKVGT